MGEEWTSVRRTTYIHGTPKLYRRPGRAEARSKAGASWSGSAGKACNAQSAICAFRAGRGTGKESLELLSSVVDDKGPEKVTDGRP